MNSFFDNAEVISVYTRAQAIADGELVDVSEMAKEAGIRYPVAVSRVVWETYIDWTDEDTKKQTIQDREGRLWDVLNMFRFYAKLNKDGSLFKYNLMVVPRDGESKKAEKVELLAHCGPGDDLNPVITIMLQEDY